MKSRKEDAINVTALLTKRTFRDQVMVAYMEKNIAALSGSAKLRQLAFLLLLPYKTSGNLCQAFAF